ncbi:MAG: porin [Gammaproteobacteria bacterium]|nr:porin [Gammaproteobacteria bacterium]
MKTTLMRKTGKSALIATSLLAMGMGTALAEGAGTTYAFGGYVKFDAMFSDYSDGVPPSTDLGRQFYVVNNIPVGDGSDSGDLAADFQARESRLFFKADTVTEGGDKIGAYVEMDFLTHGDGNELVSNSYSPRLRHAFLKYNGWLFGQTWSTFQDVAALPENLDFVGPSESTTFVRQGQVRYTTGNLEFAAENPETFYSLEGGAIRQSSGTDTIPDLVARYTFKLSNGGYIKAAGMYRQLDVHNALMDVNETALAVSVSGKFMFGKNDLRFMATAGSGVGRYLGVAAGVDAVATLDTSTTEGGYNALKAVDEMGAFVSYRHLWSDQWRSNFTYGFLAIDNPTEAPNSTKDASSIHVNLIYSPAPKLDIGAEIMVAERTMENGVDGDMTRLLISAKYAF